MSLPYLRREGERHGFVCGACVVLGTHVSLLCFYLAAANAGSAVIAAVVASFIWRRALHHGQSAAALFAAAQER